MAKSKTPGPDSKKKSIIMEKKAKSEGGPVTRTRSKTPAKKNPANADKSTTKKTPKKTPKKLTTDDKKKLTYDEEEEAVVTPAATKEKKPKTPKSSGKLPTMTPKGGVTQEGKKAASKMAEQKTPKSTKKTPSAVAAKRQTPKSAKKEVAKTPKSAKKEVVKTPKSAKKDVAKTPKSAKKEDEKIPLPYGLDDEDEDDDDDDDDDFADAVGDIDEFDTADGSDFSDDDGDHDDDEEDKDDGDDDDEEEDNDEEVVFNTPGLVKKMKSEDDVSSSLSPFRAKKTPKSALKMPPTDHGKPRKTPKSALKTKTPGEAKSGKKVSMAVTTPDGAEEKVHKKAVTTPHPSLTKLKRRPSIDEEEDNDKENSKSNGTDKEESLTKQLSFGDDNSEEDMETEVKGQSLKRTHAESKSDDTTADPPVKRRREGHYYHCGNLPKGSHKKFVRLFFAEAGIDLLGCLIKDEKLTKMERLEPKNKKKSKKLIKKKSAIDHCYARLKVATLEEGKKLENLNGVEFTAVQGKWRSYPLTIYPVLERPVKDVKIDDPCIHIRLGYKVDDQQLRDFLTAHKVEPRKTYIVRRGIRQLSKGYGFAWLKTQAEVEKAIKLTGQDLQGYKVKITQAKPQRDDNPYSYKVGSTKN